MKRLRILWLYLLFAGGVTFFLLCHVPAVLGIISERALRRRLEPLLDKWDRLADELADLLEGAGPI